ncbi:MAG: BamA/TamA family outer membrane protein [Polyangiaceae bacterium]|nr:BamA/TamA family outer membrane protein [Polyangiaceae bacterium]
MSRLVAGFLSASCTILWKGLALAQGDEPAAEAWRNRPRVIPGDDGSTNESQPEAARRLAEEPGVDPADAALSLPRAILGVPRAVMYTVFLPVEGLLYVTGKYQIPERVIDFLYNDERNAAIIPYLSFLGGQGFTAGFSAFHGGLGKHDERISLSAKFGGRYTQSYDLGFEAPRVAGTIFSIDVGTRFEIEPRQNFWGYGPGPTQDGPLQEDIGPRQAHVKTIFQQQRGLVMLRPGFAVHDAVNIGVVGTLNHRKFDPRLDETQSEPSIAEVYDTAKLPGFDQGYSLIQMLADIRVDTRSPRGATNSGVLLEVMGGGVPPQGDFGYVHYGAAITGYIDLYGGDRVLLLHASHEAVLGEDDDIPFADMPRLGGPHRLRGYDLNRFRDEKTALVAIEYHYPVHEMVSASLFFEMGSVGRDYRVLIEPENYVFSGGGGLTFQTKEAKLFGFQIAGGDGVQFFFTTDPFDEFSKRGAEL